MGKPSLEDRNMFFGRLVEASLSVSSEGTTGKSQEQALPELPKAPKVASGPKASELKAKVEAEQHALRRLRMCLRDVCNRYGGLLLFLVTCINTHISVFLQLNFFCIFLISVSCYVCIYI